MKLDRYYRCKSFRVRDGWEVRRPYGRKSSAVYHVYARNMMQCDAYAFARMKNSEEIGVMEGES